MNANHQRMAVVGRADGGAIEKPMTLLRKRRGGATIVEGEANEAVCPAGRRMWHGVQGTIHIIFRLRTVNEEHPGGYIDYKTATWMRLLAQVRTNIVWVRGGNPILPQKPSLSKPNPLLVLRSNDPHAVRKFQAISSVPLSNVRVRVNRGWIGLAPAVRADRAFAPARSH